MLDEFFSVHPFSGHARRRVVRVHVAHRLVFEPLAHHVRRLVSPFGNGMGMVSHARVVFLEFFSLWEGLFLTIFTCLGV